MVGSIRELSDRLMEMEAQLKVSHAHPHAHCASCWSHLSLTSGFQMESVNKQQEQSNEEAEKVKKEGGSGTDEFAEKDEEKERKTKENRKMKNKQQADKHKKVQEASDTVCEGEQGTYLCIETDLDKSCLTVKFLVPPSASGCGSRYYWL